MRRDAENVYRFAESKYCLQDRFSGYGTEYRIARDYGVTGDHWVARNNVLKRGEYA